MYKNVFVQQLLASSDMKSQRGADDYIEGYSYRRFEGFEIEIWNEEGTTRGLSPSHWISSVEPPCE